jgi:hypothetical protein
MTFHFCNRILIAGAILSLCCGVVCAQKAASVHAENQKLSWVMQDSGTTAGLRGIYSVDGEIAWASGTGGTVLRTTDRGEHWTKCTVPSPDGETLDFRAVQAWDAQTAIVMASGPGDKSRLYKTADGCKSWILLLKNPDAPDGFFDSFRFHKEQRLLGDHEGFGLLFGDPVKGHLSVLETRDGGYAWNRIESDSLAVQSAGNGAFAASNGCITDFGTASNFFISGGRMGSFLIRLNYQGPYWLNNSSPLTKSWGIVPLPFAKGADSIGAFAIGGHVGLSEDKAATIKGLKYRLAVVGGDYSKPNESAGSAAWSSDGGLHWTAAAKPPHGYRSSVAWSEDLKAWITVGTNGSDISRDDGKTWQPMDDGNWNALSLPFVVGPKGRIARLAVGTK